MLNIKDLDGRKLKKATGLKKITKDFCKNGDFSFTIVNKNDEHFKLLGYYTWDTKVIEEIELYNKFEMIARLDHRFYADVYIPLRMLDK